MRRTSHGFTLIELLIVVAIICIIAATALPWLIRARMGANEAAAIGSLRALVSSQHTYATASGGGYAPDLPRLGLLCPGGVVPFMSSDLTSAVQVTKSGFVIQMTGSGVGGTPVDCNGSPTATAYYISARALAPGMSAIRAFGTTSEGVIWESIVGSGTTPPTAAEMASPPTATVRPVQ